MGQLKTREVYAKDLKPGDIVVSAVTLKLSTIASVSLLASNRKYLTVELYPTHGEGPITVHWYRNGRKRILP